MNYDLRIIKKKYSENMAHLCRELFPTILEEEGVLSKLILDNFATSEFLYDDLIEHDLAYVFKDYIYSLYDENRKEEVITDIKSPKELLDEAGYILYDECMTEDDIQKFRHYYKEDEELCTFNGGRLYSCRVFFAVKKDVDKIKREDFKEPKRSDLYGTSVISIQFTKDGSNTLSIKNRYNHKVANPDATFSNNLDNIIPGLTQSFMNYYGIKQRYKCEFEIPGYIRANDGKYYKYNYEINNVYYCPNNIIINNSKVTKLEKEKYLLLDYLILDLQNLKITTLDYKDSFIESVGKISKVEIKNIKNEKNETIGKEVLITPQNGEIIRVVLSKENKIIEYDNKNVEVINDNFLFYNKELIKLNLPKVEIIKNSFLYCNESLTDLCLQNVKEIKDDFLHCNKKLVKLKLPNVKKIKDNFLYWNLVLRKIDLSSIEEIGNGFLFYNIALKELKLTKLQVIGNCFLFHDKSLIKIDLPNVQLIEERFLYYNNKLVSLDLPNVEIIGGYFLFNNKVLTEFNALKLEEIGNYFLYTNNKLTKINLPSVKMIKYSFLYSNKVLKEINISNIIEIESTFLYNNEELEELDTPNIEKIGNNSLYFNKVLTRLNMPNSARIGDGFLYNNEMYESVNKGLENVRKRKYNI